MQGITSIFGNTRVNGRLEVSNLTFGSKLSIPSGADSEVKYTFAQGNAIGATNLYSGEYLIEVSYSNGDTNTYRFSFFGTKTATPILSLETVISADGVNTLNNFFVMYPKTISDTVIIGFTSNTSTKSIAITQLNSAYISLSESLSLTVYDDTKYNLATIDATLSGKISRYSTTVSMDISVENVDIENLTLDTLKSDIIPDITNTRSLGSATNVFKDAYATTFHGALDGNASSADKLTVTSAHYPALLYQSTLDNIPVTLAHPSPNYDDEPDAMVLYVVREYDSDSDEWVTRLLWAPEGSYVPGELNWRPISYYPASDSAEASSYKTGGMTSGDLIIKPANKGLTMSTSGSDANKTLELIPDLYHVKTTTQIPFTCNLIEEISE